MKHLDSNYPKLVISQLYRILHDFYQALCLDPLEIMFDRKNLCPLQQIVNSSQFFVSFVFTKKCLFEIKGVQKFSFIAHIIPGLFLTGLCFVEGYPYVAVALVTLSLGFNGSATLTNLQNAQDLSPNYAGEYFPHLVQVSCHN